MSFKDYLKVCTNLVNLLIFVYMFSATSFNYYLINFYLKYIPGNVFINTSVAAIADFVAHVGVGFIVRMIGNKNAFTLSFLITFGAGAILWYLEDHEKVDDVPYVVLGAKFGASAAFAMLYMSTICYFPSKFMGVVFGICNVTARAITILAPMVAEAPEPMPEFTMIVSCLIATVLSRCITQTEVKPVPKDLPEMDDLQKYAQ